MSIRTKPAKVVKEKKPVGQNGLQMTVKRQIDVRDDNGPTLVRSKSKSFGSLLKELEAQQAEVYNQNKNTVITRGLMGEGEITFTVEKKKKKPRNIDELELDDGDDDGSEYSRRKERDSGRKSQRFAGRRSASKNVFRKMA
ncbi:hypothetical protein V1514DRAFT_369440 [Lipomyces japonicus]|uniref:uncharacterized protein n=1 Tax=Lipomyces japonicus TaxID=56871 RepID=UPI0034CF6D1F